MPISVEPTAVEPTAVEPTAVEKPSDETVAPDNRGTTTSVVRGSVWSLGGQGVILLASLVATPFLLRVLDTESYGVWFLITSIMGTLGFADAGMGTASTRFCADAFARHDERRERAVVWTALALSAVPTTIFVGGTIIGAPFLVAQFFGRLPAELQAPTILALRIAALGFGVRMGTHIFNSPLLARLRLDLNTILIGGLTLLQVAVLPIVMKFGGLVWGALWFTFISVLLTLTLYAATARVLPGAARPLLSRELASPLIRYGGPAFIAALAAQLLANADKLLVGRLAITEATYYGLAVTAANVLLIAPQAFGQALLPAFSRLLASPENSSDKAALQRLISRCVRLTLFLMPPIAMAMCMAARPFFAHWAGSNYELLSTPPFYWLIAGTVLNMLVYIPYTLILAHGRSDLTAKFHLAESVPFLAYTALLTQWGGGIGAAIARDVRVVIFCAVMFPLAQRMFGVGFSPHIRARGAYALAMIALIAPLFLLLCRVSFAIEIVATLLALFLYARLLWTQVLEADEQQGVRALVAFAGRRLRRG